MLTVCGLLWVSGCSGGEHGHDHGEHGHGEHGHDTEEDERPDIAVTLYQGHLELFMEYPAFVVGMDSPLIAHFTGKWIFSESSASFVPILFSVSELRQRKSQ